MILKSEWCFILSPVPPPPPPEFRSCLLSVVVCVNEPKLNQTIFSVFSMSETALPKDYYFVVYIFLAHIRDFIQVSSYICDFVLSIKSLRDQVSFCFFLIIL